MAEPVVAARTPIAVDLLAGRSILYCTCGRSERQPFCDGAHKGTGMQPHSYTPDTSGKVWLCRCKQTANPPLCDGSHRRVPADQIGRPFNLASAAFPARNGGEADASAWPDSPARAESQLTPSVPETASESRQGGRGVDVEVRPHPRQSDAADAMPVAAPTEEEPYVALIHEPAPAKFGYRKELLERVQAFHFHCGQATKTGLGLSVVPRPRLRSHNHCPVPCPSPSGSPRGPRTRHLDHHGRAPYRRGLPQGHGPRRGWHRGGERSHSGGGLHRRQDLSHECMSRRGHSLPRTRSFGAD